LHFHDYGFTSLAAYRLYEWLLSMVSDRIVAVIDSEKDQAIAEGFTSANRVTVIRTGLDDTPPPFAGKRMNVNSAAKMAACKKDNQVRLECATAGIFDHCLA
jgi:hypothetical protein